jgi:peptidyl-prolyl cis-trans isomerase SurA
MASVTVRRRRLDASGTPPASTRHARQDRAPALLAVLAVAAGALGPLGPLGPLEAAAAAPGAAAAAPRAQPPAASRPAAGAAAASPAPVPGTAPNVLKDRVLAVVDDDPILASDLQRAIVVGQLQPQAGETERAFHRRVLDDLVAQRLRFHEIERFGLEQVPVDQIEKQVAEVRARFKDDATFRRQLHEVGLDEASLRQLMARQLEVLAFVDERLGPQVFVGLDDIAAYYRNVLTPQLQKQRLPVPPLDNVREQIREVLRQQRLTGEIDRWTEELRRKANIAVYIDHPTGGPLPPVVKRLELGKKPTVPPLPAGAPGKPPG